MVMTVAIVDIDYAEGHEQAIVSSVSHNVPSLQSQLETMDEQLWGAGISGSIWTICGVLHRVLIRC